MAGAAARGAVVGGRGEPTYDAVERLRTAHRRRESARTWVLEVNGRSVGFGQHYRIADYPDYALLVPDPAAIGVDYAIGEPDWTGRGLGSRMIWAWALRARAAFPDAPVFFAAPDHRNAASRRVLARAGFVEGRGSTSRATTATSTPSSGASRRGHGHRLTPRSKRARRRARTART